MAGETSGASEANRRRRLEANDRGTNKIYASGQRSVFAAAVGGDRSRTGGRGVKTPVVKADDRSADKYYAVGGSERPRGGGKPLGPPPKLGKGPAVRPAVAGPLTVDAAADVSAVIDEVVARLAAGESPLTVTVRAGASDLLKRTRAALDLRVTRADITEDQYGAVRIAYASPAALGDPAPAAPKVVVPEAEVTAADPLAFLNSDYVEPAVDTSPAVAVDASDTVAAADADDDDTDYTPAAEPAANAEPPAAAQDSGGSSPRRGRNRR